jgi:hypothetical protein
MRVDTNGLRFKIGDAAPKIVNAGDYETTDPTEIELLTNLWNAGAVVLISN